MPEFRVDALLRWRNCPDAPCDPMDIEKAVQMLFEDPLGSVACLGAVIKHQRETADLTPDKFHAIFDAKASAAAMALMLERYIDFFMYLPSAPRVQAAVQKHKSHPLPQNSGS